MSEAAFRSLWPRRSLSTTKVRLCSYSKEPIVVLGQTTVKVLYKGQTASLPLLVVKGSGPTLLGRNWMKEIRLDWKFIHHVNSPGLEELLGKYATVFRDELGTMQGL